MYGRCAAIRDASGWKAQPRGAGSGRAICLHLIYNGKHHVQRVVGAGDADGCGLIGQDAGQAARDDVNVGHEFVEVLCQDFAGHLRHGVFGRGADAPRSIATVDG